MFAAFEEQTSVLPFKAILEVRRCGLQEHSVVVFWGGIKSNPVQRNHIQQPKLKQNKIFNTGPARAPRGLLEGVRAPALPHHRRRDPRRVSPPPLHAGGQLGRARLIGSWVLVLESVVGMMCLVGCNCRK